VCMKFENPFVLAPMAGVNCTAFRLMCKEAGAGLIYTQMYHADFISHKYENDGKIELSKYINIIDSERPVTIQLVGHDPVTMAKAAKYIEPLADIIDINLGCPDTNMIKSGCGAYYSKYPDKIKPIVNAVIDVVKKPVTAKIRIGWDSQTINGVMVAEMLERLGAAAIAVHGRVAVQKYAGKANWQIIKHIKQKISIPVIGNGDAKNKKKATDMLEQTGCDAVMIGRRAMGDPGIFTRCNNRYYNREDDIIDPVQQFLKFLEYYKKYDQNKSFSELRTHALWFSKRARLGPKNRNTIMRAKDISELSNLFEKNQKRK